MRRCTCSLTQISTSAGAGWKLPRRVPPVLYPLRDNARRSAAIQPLRMQHTGSVWTAPKNRVEDSGREECRITPVDIWSWPGAADSTPVGSSIERYSSTTVRAGTYGNRVLDSNWE